jgi:hypothetical protein
MRRSAPSVVSPDRRAEAGPCVDIFGGPDRVAPPGAGVPARPGAPRATIRALATVAALAALGVIPRAAFAGESPAAPVVARLRASVERLAAPEFAGRRGEGAARAAAFLAEQFQALGLEPLFDDGFTQTIPGDDPKAPIGRNVGALLPGSDPALRDDWVLVSAHFDHLGVIDGVLYPGADDDASGVAMLLEVARALAERPQVQRPRRSIAFVGFDCEEQGLLGSKHFVAEPPRDLGRLKLMISADMLARALGGVCDEFLFVMGSEHAPGLRPWVRRAADGLPVRVGLIGADMLLRDRSDYGPFRRRRIPYLFLSAGESPVYHTPDDRPETLDYDKLGAVTHLVGRLVEQAADADAVPGWSDEPDHELDEAVVIRDVLRRLAIASARASWMSRRVAELDAAIASGRLTPLQRRRMVLHAQLILYSVL